MLGEYHEQQEQEIERLGIDSKECSELESLPVSTPIANTIPSDKVPSTDNDESGL